VQSMEWVSLSGRFGGVGSMIHQDWSGPAARTCSMSPPLAAVSSAVRAGRDQKLIGSLAKPRECFAAHDDFIGGVVCGMLSPTAAKGHMNIVERKPSSYDL
jgi:hypothetical protein